MKTIGLIGGMSFESTALYYRLINEEVRRRLGGLHSAQIAMISVDFHEIEHYQHNGDWLSAGRVLAKAGQSLERAGADFLVLCTNTMHRVADFIESAASIPLLHIADATAEEIRRHEISRVGLLGTAFTMEEAFYKERMTEKFAIDVLTPDAVDRAIVHRVIYEELCRGIVDNESRTEYLRIIEDLAQRGAEGVIEGCTEIVMLVEEQHTNMRLFDTTAIHAMAAVDASLGES
ncbi:MAG: racemase [marine bacterium B5-7]|nr:MAG: racemase [marine bacterium B5-7]